MMGIMSKDVKATIYIDGGVSSVKQARNMADRAMCNQNRIKSDIFSLVMATPKDVTPEGNDPHGYLLDKFEDLWDELWDAFIDHYKYMVVADDAEYLTDSLVKKSWEEEEAERNLLKDKEDRMRIFFNKYKQVFNKHNIDDILIYEAYSEGEITLPSHEEITVNDREKILIKIRKKDEEILKGVMEKIKDGK